MSLEQELIDNIVENCRLQDAMREALQKSNAEDAPGGNSWMAAQHNGEWHRLHNKRSNLAERTSAIRDVLGVDLSTELEQIAIKQYLANNQSFQ